MALKPKRFIRIPFAVVAYLVDDENMDEIAEWCGGHVVRETERPFVRVPVNRTTNKRQTEAYIGCWVLLSMQRGERSFKVYTQEYLDKNFMEIPDQIEDPDPEPEPTKPDISVVCGCGQVHPPATRSGNVVKIPTPAVMRPTIGPGIHRYPLA